MLGTLTDIVPAEVKDSGYVPDGALVNVLLPTPLVDDALVFGVAIDIVVESTASGPVKVDARLVELAIDGSMEGLDNEL